jgi:hypothetical protein
MDKQDTDSRQYPPFVTDADQRQRWDCARASAEILFREHGEAAVWQATRVLYHGPVPT